MKNQKVYLEHIIDLTKRFLMSFVTFWGAQVAFWTVYFLNGEFTNPVVCIALFGFITNTLICAVLLVALVKKIKAIGDLE